MELEQAVKALSALAQESRLQVFRLLARSGETGLPAGQIAGELDIPSATLSFHLKELSYAGMVERRRQGRLLIYSLSIPAIRSLLAYLLEDCCQGRAELCQPFLQGLECCDRESAADLSRASVESSPKQS